MKKSDVKMWLEALRSGEYRQGNGFLRSDRNNDEHEFCCLGVACDVLAESDWIKGPDSDTWSIGTYKGFKFPEPHRHDRYAPDAKWKVSDTASFPSLSVLKEIGLDLHYAQDLAELNDNGWSFKKIANKIEKDLL